MHLKHHIEQEIKLTATDQSSLDALLDNPLLQQHRHHSCEQAIAQSFAATYYDTENWALRDLRWSLRTRYEGERHISTLKRNSSIEQGFSSCEEIEQAVEAGFSQVACVPAGEISDALHSVLTASTPLLPRVKVNMQRSKRILLIGDTLVELVTDAGQISANGQSTQLFEVELERLQGDLKSTACEAFTRQLIEQHSLQPSLKSKHQLGLAFYSFSDRLS